MAVPGDSGSASAAPAVPSIVCVASGSAAAPRARLSPGRAMDSTALNHGAKCQQRAGM